MKKYVLMVFFVILASLSMHTVFGESNMIGVQENKNVFRDATITWIDRCIIQGHTSAVRIIDYNMNKDPEIIEQFEIEIWSDSENKIVTPYATETGKDTGVFEVTVFFFTTDEGSTHRVQAFAGDTVFAKYTANSTIHDIADKEDSISDMPVVAKIPVLEEDARYGKFSDIVYGPCTISYLERLKDKSTTHQFEMFFPAPLKQIQSGLYTDEIVCSEYMIFVARNDGSPACVEEPSIAKLVERRWAKDMTDSAQHPLNIDGLILNSQTSPENNYHLFTNELEKIDTGSSGITLFGINDVDDLHGKFVRVSGSIIKNGGEDAIRVDTFQITGSLIPKGTSGSNTDETLFVENLLENPGRYYNQEITIRGELREHGADVMVEMGVGCFNAKFSTSDEFTPEFTSSQQLYNDREEQIGVRIGSVNNVGISTEKLPPELKNKQVEITGTFVPTVKKYGWHCMPTIYHSGYILTDLEKINLVK